MITIREATPDDVGALAAVHADAVALAYAGVFDAAEPPPAPEHLMGRWATLLATPRSWVGVLDDGGTVAGMIGVRPSPDADADADTGELVGLHVHPSHWGQGHGGWLVEEAELTAGALALPRLRLWVLEANIRARRMYVRRGWERDGAKKFVAGNVRELRYCRVTH
jgi:RimJ/RimL family protein N-acetyltransferase